MNRPNILFIMTDQQRWDTLGCNGGWVRTPNLDRRWKMALNREGRPYLLFDLENDPRELRNLAGLPGMAQVILG